jgi:hypothetical protein
VAKKQRRRNEHLVVNVCHMACANGDARLSQAIDILLRSAARDAAQAEQSNTEKEKLPRQARTEDALSPSVEAGESP